jgi:hypothetical protein
LKSKPNGKSWETLVGVQKRRKIRDIVLSSGTHGISVSEINAKLSARQIKISRQQLHDYLKQECSAGRFYKSGTKYVADPLVTIDDWSIFADYITRLQYFAMFNNLPVGNYLQQNFNDDALEDALFKFSSRLGALISYVIIEALRPTEHLKLQRHRQQIALNFVKDSISPENLLQSFLAALPYNFRIKHNIGLILSEGQNVPSVAPLVNQFYINKDRNPLLELISAFNKVYPNLYDSLEKGYREHVSIEPEARCDHEWETIIIHKIGEGYKCHRCLHTIEKEAFKRVFLK